MAWTELAALIGLISFLITVLIDMFSRVFSLQTVRMWVKSEYSQVAVTFLIILMAASIETVGNRIVGRVAGDVAIASGNVALGNAVLAHGTAPTTIAKAYIDTVVTCERNIYRIVYWINLFVEAFSKISFDIAHVEGLGAALALTGWVTLFHYIMSNIVYLVLFHYIQYNTLLLSQYSMLAVFLPIGLVLRALAITRGAGGFVVAFAMGFAFIFPMTYVIIVAMMPSADTMCKQVELAAEPLSLQKQGQDPCFNNAGEVMDYYYRVKNSESHISNIIDNAQSLLGLLFLQAVFYPLASLIITLTFIRQTGSLFGADLAEIGRGLIKLI